MAARARPLSFPARLSLSPAPHLIPLLSRATPSPPLSLPPSLLSQTQLTHTTMSTASLETPSKALGSIDLASTPSKPASSFADRLGASSDEPEAAAAEGSKQVLKVAPAKMTRAELEARFVGDLDCEECDEPILQETSVPFPSFSRSGAGGASRAAVVQHALLALHKRVHPSPLPPSTVLSLPKAPSPPSPPSWTVPCQSLSRC